MPRAALPTPASSTDIPGQDGTKQLASLQMAFELPPPALTSGEASRSPNAPATSSPVSPEPRSRNPPKAPFPSQVAETVKSRKRTSAVRAQEKDAFALPPPPTRSRKIIQMKPRVQEDGPAEDSAAAKGSSGSAAPAPAAPAATTAAASKKKQPSATSAAGRKIARKTAHSLIERRRRSKMNEEFGVLKDMIPACTGEMHKLAILQVCCRNWTARGRDPVLTLSAGIHRICSVPGGLCRQASSPARRAVTHHARRRRSADAVPPSGICTRRAFPRSSRASVPGCGDGGLRSGIAVEPNLHFARIAGRGPEETRFVLVRVDRSAALQLRRLDQDVTGLRTSGVPLCPKQHLDVRVDADESGPRAGERLGSGGHGGSADAQQRSKVHGRQLQRAGHERP